MYTPLEPAVAYPLFLVLGLAVGSFGNVVAGRLPAGESLDGRSHCPHCSRTLSVLELIPVISWLLLRAKCRGCAKPISAQYPLVELAAGFLFMLALPLQDFLPLQSLALALAFWVMLIIVIIDARTQLIPDALTITLALCGAVLCYFSGVVPVIAVLIGLGFFGIQWIISRGRWVGSGDIFLSGALGLLLQRWDLMVVSLFIAYIGGSFIVVALLASKKIQRHAHVAFGPFLIGGAFIALLFGDRLLQAFLW
jgi:leader peptidase (prepilin peptidase)/N-methyltransferase